MTSIFRVGSALIFLLLVSACEDGIGDIPLPQALPEGAVGTYCGMILTEHAGPKAQIFEKGRSEPLWFTAIRDAVTYTRLPGEGQSVVGFYVHDMARASSWEKPQSEGIWITADAAFFVVGSNRLGGMGMPETVPFGTVEAAETFAEKYGGHVFRLTEIPVSALLVMDTDNGDKIADQHFGAESQK